MVDHTHPELPLSGLNHPNLVAMRGFCADPACIVTEYVGAGSLQAYLSDQEKPLDWALRLKIAKDIGACGCSAIPTPSAVSPNPLSRGAAKGCQFLHSTSPPVIHRDLKSPNVLLASVSSEAEVVAKVCDFGVSFMASAQTAGRRVDCPGLPKIRLPS